MASLESPRCEDAMANKHLNTQGVLPASSNAIGQTNEVCKPDVLNWLRDSEAAPQAEAGLTHSQTAQIRRTGGRTGGRIGCNRRKSKVCRNGAHHHLVIRTCDCSHQTAWTPSIGRQAVLSAAEFFPHLCWRCQFQATGVLVTQQGLCLYEATVLHSNKEHALPLRMTISPDFLKTRRLLSGECQIVVVI